MIEVNLNNKEQHGGFYAIEILTLDEIVSAPKILTNENVKDMVLNPSVSSVDILPVAESLSISETVSSNRSGTLYNITGSFDIPYQSSEIDDFFHELRHQEIIMIGIKHYKQRKVYGSTLHPLRLTHEMINGKKLEEGSLIRVKISGKIAQKPVFLQG
jgi:hypothetical protein